MKKLILLGFAFVIFGCGSNNHITDVKEVTGATATQFANTITASDLKTHLYIIASDEFEGRGTGEPGQKKAAEYLKNFYISQNISSPFGGDDYFQEIPTAHLKPDLNPSENVLAFIEGSEKPEEILVISAHYDHLGIRDGEIYNGADDDGSGNVAIMEIAEAFKKAAINGNGPKRSILFLHVTGEEKGLLGSKFYTNFPVFPLANTVTNLNIDMIGRVDDAHENNPDFVYVIGSYKLSSELHSLSEDINSRFTNLILDYRYNDEEDPNRFYYRSDHYNFAKNNIPIIFYFNGTHDNYHRPSDTPDKINYEILQKRTQLIFYTAWEIANRENRIVVDK
ncbi:M28 family metallopeptidase [Lutibacter flavus]|uniref:Peptidase family M28 n=1 Tax=Lutibacter flavus TaxID=691689 RepID=A0A238VBC0_9FLAO|nr:M28 family metallopeptidase [Lutibacter flavus]SNR31712.1 Peptidase family M28 [Lutibacter flavus]